MGFERATQQGPNTPPLIAHLPAREPVPVPSPQTPPALVSKPLHNFILNLELHPCFVPGTAVDDEEVDEEQLKDVVLGQFDKVRCMLSGHSVRRARCVSV